MRERVRNKYTATLRTATCTFVYPSRKAPFEHKLQCDTHSPLYVGVGDEEANQGGRPLIQSAQIKYDI